MKYNQKHKRGMPYPLCNPPHLTADLLYSFLLSICFSSRQFFTLQKIISGSPNFYNSRNRLPLKLPPCFFFHFKNRPKNKGLCHSCPCFHSVNLSLRPDTQLSFSVCHVSLPSWFPLPPCRVKGNGQLNKQGGTQNEKFAHT